MRLWWRWLALICTVLTEKHVRVTACIARMPVTHVFQCISKLIPSIITAHLLKQRYLLVLSYKVAFLSYFRLSLEKITRQCNAFDWVFPVWLLLGGCFIKHMQRYVLFKRKKVAYGTYSHWKSYIVRITLTLYEVFDANFLDSRVCNKCSLSVPLDSSNSVEKLCDSWVWVRRYVALVVSVPIPLRTQLVRTPTRRKAFLRNYGKQKNLTQTEGVLVYNFHWQK